jgi:beta-galactosidase
VNRLIVFSLALFLCAQGFAQAPLPSSPRRGPLMLGAAWYPEQWPESRWEADLALMEAAHINFVRVGEFAWSTMEPKESDYQLDWMERAVRGSTTLRW